MAEVATVLVTILATGQGPVRINESDFRGDLHERWVHTLAALDGDAKPAAGGDEPPPPPGPQPLELSAKDAIALVAEASAEKLAEIEAAENAREDGARKTVAKAIAERRATLQDPT